MNYGLGSKIATLRAAGVPDAQIALATGLAVRTIQTYASRERSRSAVSQAHFLRRLAVAHAQFADLNLGLGTSLDLPNAILLVFAQPDVALMRSAAQVMIGAGYVLADDLAPLLELLRLDTQKLAA
jgi:hypothetical protein